MKMEKEKIFGILFALAIFILSMNLVSSSGTLQLLCLTKNQTVQFSKCNPAIPDKTCTATSCQYCVTYDAATNIYCPASINSCNNAECHELQGSSSGTTGTLSITNINANPRLPVNITKSNAWSINIRFTSSVYPLNVSVALYNGGILKDLIFYNLPNSGAQPVKYTMPNNLVNGSYIIEMTSSYGKESQTDNIGTVNVGTF